MLRFCVWNRDMDVNLQLLQFLIDQAERSIDNCGSTAGISVSRSPIKLGKRVIEGVDSLSRMNSDF